MPDSSQCYLSWLWASRTRADAQLMNICNSAHKDRQYSRTIFFMGTSMLCVCFVQVCARTHGERGTGCQQLSYVWTTTHLSLLPLPNLPFHTTCYYLSTPCLQCLI